MTPPPPPTKNDEPRNMASWAPQEVVLQKIREQFDGSLTSSGV
jgi:hypothetical protein